MSREEYWQQQMTTLVEQVLNCDEFCNKNPLWVLEARTILENPKEEFRPHGRDSFHFESLVRRVRGD